MYRYVTSTLKLFLHFFFHLKKYFAETFLSHVLTGTETSCDFDETFFFKH